MPYPVPDKPDVCGKIKLNRYDSDDVRLCVLPRNHLGLCSFADPYRDSGWNKWDLDDDDTEELVPA